MNEHLSRIRDELGIETTLPPEKCAESFDEQLQVVFEEGVPVFSYTFGVLSAEVHNELKRSGTIVIGTATTMREAVELAQAGADAIVAQGSEAGGHRGTFLSDPDDSLIGTTALLPQVVDAVSVPVVASGGIMDGRGLVAALALGASAVQMGTAFVPRVESGAHPVYKDRVLSSKESDTAITTAYSGKPARGIRTGFKVIRGLTSLCEIGDASSS